MRLSDGEWKVMQVVWDSGPVTARDVLDAVAPETRWAYTTVKTMLDRLVAKGALTLDRAATAGVYKSALSRENARRTAVEGLVERAFEGAFAPLLRFAVEGRTLTDEDRAALRSLLDEEESRSRRSGRRAPGK
jgi:BlaI family penicillinase repressor